MKKQLIALCAIVCMALVFTTHSNASIGGTGKSASSEKESAFIVKSFTCYYGGYEIHVSFNLPPQSFGPTALVLGPSTYASASVIAGTGDTWVGDGSYVAVSGLVLYMSSTNEYLFPADGDYYFDPY